MLVEYLFAQTPRVSVGRVGVPSLQTGFDLIPLHPVFGVGQLQVAEATAETNDIAPHQPTVVWKHTPPEERDAIGAPVHPRLAVMHAQTKLIQFGFQMEPCFVQELFVLVEQDEVIHIAGIGTGPDLAQDEMVELVQVDVGEELGCLIPERETRRRSRGVKRSSPGNHAVTVSCGLEWSMTVAARSKVPEHLTALANCVYKIWWSMEAKYLRMSHLSTKGNAAQA